MSRQSSPESSPPIPSLKPEQQNETPLAQVSWVADASREEPEQVSGPEWVEGPWRVTGRSDYAEESSNFAIRDEEDFVLAAVITDTRKLRRRGKATARLIAAAPELYEALEELAAAFACEVIVDGKVQPADPAIAKAVLVLAKARGEGGAR